MRGGKATGFFLVGVALVLALCQRAFAHEALVIAFDSHSVPTMYAGPRGEALGIYPAIVRGAFARMGEPVQTVALPFRRGMQALQRGEMGVGSSLITPERARFARFSKPYFIERVSVFSAAGKGRTFRSLADLHGTRVGVLRGWAYGADFDAARAARRFVVDEVDSDERNFTKLGLGRLDYVVATTLSGEYVIAGDGFAGIEAFPVDLVAAPIHLAIPHQSRYVRLIERFDAAVAEMRRTGEIDAIVAAEVRLASARRAPAAPAR